MSSVARTCFDTALQWLHPVNVFPPSSSSVLRSLAHFSFRVCYYHVIQLWLTPTMTACAFTKESSSSTLCADEKLPDNKVEAWTSAGRATLCDSVAGAAAFIYSVGLTCFWMSISVAAIFFFFFLKSYIHNTLTLLFMQQPSVFMCLLFVSHLPWNQNKRKSITFLSLLPVQRPRMWFRASTNASCHNPLKCSECVLCVQIRPFNTTKDVSEKSH